MGVWHLGEAGVSERKNSQKRTWHERAFSKRRASRRMGREKRRGATIGNHVSGSARIDMSAPTMSAIVVYAPCGCHTTRYCCDGSRVGGDRTLRTWTPAEAMRAESARAMSEARGRGPQASDDPAALAEARYHSAYRRSAAPSRRCRRCRRSEVASGEGGKRCMSERCV